MLNFFQLIFLIIFSFLNANSSLAGDLPSPQKPYANGSAIPKEYVVPRTAKTESLQKVVESKSCKQYLDICERSCKERGSMFKFQCIGQEFPPFEDHSRCTCADDLYARKEAPRQEQIHLKQNQDAEK